MFLPFVLLIACLSCQYLLALCLALLPASTDATIYGMLKKQILGRLLTVISAAKLIAAMSAALCSASVNITRKPNVDWGTPMFSCDVL